MKKLILYLGILTIINSCGPQIYFEQSQPTNIEREKIFPKSLQGIYIDNKNKDFIYIIDKFTIEYRNTKKQGGILDGMSWKGQLSDSLILKNNENQFYLNLKSDNENKWFVIIISMKDDDNLIARFIDGDNQTEVEKLKRITTVQEIIDTNGDIDSYLINPTNIELEKMLQVEMFSIKMTFTKIKK